MSFSLLPVKIFTKEIKLYYCNFFLTFYSDIHDCSSYMRILDPIHKYIIFSDLEARIVDSRVFQRLRYIRQLGFAEFSFPGAVHNRFLHSLGVCHLAGRAFDSLFPVKNNFLTLEKRKQFKQILRLAALLHDVGHGPLSHTSERVMPLLSELNLPYRQNQEVQNKQARHEHYSIKFILDSDLTGMISALDVDPLYVAHLINEQVPLPDNDFFISKGLDFKPLLKQIISSDLDVDRMDYLQRDSFFCGTDYGLCDHEWILNNLKIHLKKDRAFLAIGQKAMYSVESFLLGRRHISLAVYFHNKMVIMEEMLNKYFASPDCDFYIPSALKEYLSCTDFSLLQNLRRAESKNEWARRLVNREPYERVYEVQYSYLKKDEWIEKIENVKESLHKKNIPFIHTNSLKHTSRLYFNKEQNVLPIYIMDEFNGSVEPLHEKMKMFDQKNFILLMDRFYVAPENKEKVRKFGLVA